jgi:hypothetical protein
MQGAGYLAIWSDLAPQNETDWAHWITREHAAERRRHQRISGVPHLSARWASR